MFSYGQRCNNLTSAWKWGLNEAKKLRMNQSEDQISRPDKNSPLATLSVGANCKIMTSQDGLT